MLQLTQYREVSAFDFFSFSSDDIMGQFLPFLMVETMAAAERVCTFLLDIFFNLPVES